MIIKFSVENMGKTNAILLEDETISVNGNFHSYWGHIGSI
jgi:hypothetical protein